MERARVDPAPGSLGLLWIAGWLFTIGFLHLAFWKADQTAVQMTERKAKGRQVAWINPADAAPRGIRTGDIVRVYNDRGAILATVEVTDRVRSQVLRLPEGGWYDPAAPGRQGALDKEGSVNVLTLDIGTSKLAQGNVADTALVQVEKYTAAPPSVTAYTPPAVKAG